MKSIKLLAILALAAATLAPSVQALTLEDFEIRQSIDDNQYPAIRVKFDRAADDWTVVTDDMVDVRILYTVRIKATHALVNSKVTISLDEMRAEDPLHSTNDDIKEIHSDTLRLRKPGSQLGEIKQTALDICKTIRRNGGKPNKEHRINRMFSAHGHIEASTTSPVFYSSEAADAHKLMRVDVVKPPADSVSPFTE